MSADRHCCFCVCVQMVSVGLCSVFELLRETQATQPVLCHRTLLALLNILQSQTPEGLCTEPADIVGMICYVCVSCVCVCVCVCPAVMWQSL